MGLIMSNSGILNSGPQTHPSPSPQQRRGSNAKYQVPRSQLYEDVTVSGSVYTSVSGSRSHTGDFRHEIENIKRLASQNNEP